MKCLGAGGHSFVSRLSCSTLRCRLIGLQNGVLARQSPASNGLLLFHELLFRTEDLSSHHSSSQATSFANDLYKLSLYSAIQELRCQVEYGSRRPCLKATGVEVVHENPFLLDTWRTNPAGR